MVVPDTAGLLSDESADVVILTALAKEQRAVVAALGPTEQLRWLGGDLYRGRVGPYRVIALAPMGMGNTAAGVATQQAIDVWNPLRLLLVGIAGGAATDPTVRLGDVLVPDKVVGYEPGKRTPKGFEPDPDPHRPSFDLLTAAKAVRPEEWVPSIVTPRPAHPEASAISHVGTVFTGEKVLADRQTMGELSKGWRKAIGVEMESLGVATAAYRGGPGFLVVKAVCDHADRNKADDWQPYAAEAAAQFAVAVLRREPFAVTSRTQARPRAAPSFAGPVKVAVCDRLYQDWERLADYFAIRPHEVAGFPHGRGPQRVWEWLEARDKLYALPAALDAIGRSDLVPLFAA